MRIRDAKGRMDGNSGYTRALGNEELGKLISRDQSTVISNGTELERIVISLTNVIEDLEEFIERVTDGQQMDGVYLCQKKTIKASCYAIAGKEPDLLIFVVERRRVCKVIELKDGDVFDTKKASGERQHLEEFAREFGAQIPFVTEFYVCSFNQESKEAIQVGFKHKFEIEHIMTGMELCELLDIDYDAINAQRRADMADNFDYFIKELLRIPEAREKILEELNQQRE